MSRKEFGRFTLLGLPLRAEASWLLVAAFSTWGLARTLFPAFLHGASSDVYLGLGALGSAGMFASVLAHELAHATVGRWWGMQLEAVRLFILDSVGPWRDEPTTASAEFWTAAAGPLVSLLLAGVTGLGAAGSALAGWPAAIVVLGYLSAVNAVLASLELLPVYPLDGGRLLRAILWRFTDNPTKATAWTCWFGWALGSLALVAGGWMLLASGPWAGLLGMLLGICLLKAAHESLRQNRLRQLLLAAPVWHCSRPVDAVVPGWASLWMLAVNEGRAQDAWLTPVVESGRLLGCVPASRLAQVPRRRWSDYQVADIAERCSARNTIVSTSSAWDALSKMRRCGREHLLVIGAGRFWGIVSLDDLLTLPASRLVTSGPPASSIELAPLAFATRELRASAA